jgi:hypothetical protein
VNPGGQTGAIRGRSGAFPGRYHAFPGRFEDAKCPFLSRQVVENEGYSLKNVRFFVRPSRTTRGTREKGGKAGTGREVEASGEGRRPLVVFDRERPHVVRQTAHETQTFV